MSLPSSEKRRSIISLAPWPHVRLRMNSRPSLCMASSSALWRRERLPAREEGGLGVRLGRVSGSESLIRTSPSSSSVLVESVLTALRRSTCIPTALAIPIVVFEADSRSRESCKSWVPSRMVCFSQPGPNSSRQFILREFGELRIKCFNAQIELYSSLAFIE